MVVARDNGHLFLRALLVVAWAGWATFVLSVLVEVPSALFGRTPVRLPGLRTQQRVAAGLISAVILLVGTPAVASTANATAQPSRSVWTMAANEQGFALVYVVARGDQLGAVADRFSAIGTSTRASPDSMG